MNRENHYYIHIYIITKATYTQLNKVHSKCIKQNQINKLNIFSQMFYLSIQTLDNQICKLF